MITYLLFAGAGALSGAIIAYALDMKTPKQLIQGAVGGIVTGLVLALLLPH